MGLFRSEEQYIEYSTNIKESFYTFVDRPQFIENVDGFSREINGDSFHRYLWDGTWPMSHSGRNGKKMSQR